MVSDAKTLYNEGKLLVRAMDYPGLSHGISGLQYDCSIWANEFCILMNGGMSSVSTTLIIPGVGVSTYKNIGFLVNSDLADCFHISKIDSGSRGDVRNGDFWAKEPDFATISELADYIKTNNDTNMNEVNINTTIDSVVGLFISECPAQDKLLQRTYIAKRCLKSMMGIDYPIYSYNFQEGKLNRIELTPENEQQVIESLKTTQIYYWPDEYSDPVMEDISKRESYTR